VELGRLTDTPTPHIDAVYALTKLLAQTVATSRIEAPVTREVPADIPQVANALRKNVAKFAPA
jgi:hypothetical protein